MNYSNSAYKGGTGYSNQMSCYSQSSACGYGAQLVQYDSQAVYANSESEQQESVPVFYHESPEVFLEPNAPALPVVQETNIIMPLVEQTFQELTDEALPKNIHLSIVDELTLRTIHASTGGKWSQGIQGFSLNRYGKGLSEIYVKQGPLDNVMLTIGHELGHVMSPSFANSVEEEAKAFAFSMAWVNTIRSNNIGNIAGSFRENPAQNGIHDTGFAWAVQLVQKGKTAAQVFMNIVCRKERIHDLTQTIMI